MWPLAATLLFVLDPRCMKTPDEKLKYPGSIVKYQISYVVLFCCLLADRRQQLKIEINIHAYKCCVQSKSGVSMRIQASFVSQVSNYSRKKKDRNRNSMCKIKGQHLSLAFGC